MSLKLCDFIKFNLKGVRKKAGLRPLTMRSMEYFCYAPDLQLDVKRHILLDTILRVLLLLLLFITSKHFFSPTKKK